MKFAIVAVVLALVLGAQSSYIAPLAPLSPYSALAPLSPFSPLAPLAYSTSHSYIPYPYINGPFAYNFAPHHSLLTAPAVYAPHYSGEGTYVAKTRGSEHIAPLPGHTESAASINLEPAPGTL